MIAIVTILLIILRPKKINEAVWALLGAVILVVLGFLPFRSAISAVLKGTDVYLFLAGMMLLAETAREQKLFDWLACRATAFARGSATKLFLLIYGVGTLVTIFLSNDATAVVLTPAVAYAMKSAKVKQPLPYLFICAFIANAASFVLPISNPANLVIYGQHMPQLSHWLSMFVIPSLVSVITTYFVLQQTQRKPLLQKIDTITVIPPLPTGGKMALIGIAVTAIILLVSSAFNIQLGLPTAIAGTVISLLVMLTTRSNPMGIIKGVSWPVLVLVAGLFVIVEALSTTGVTNAIVALLQQHAGTQPHITAWAAGLCTALGSNIMNNLPVGLFAGAALQASHVSTTIQNAVLVGVDLGPNLSVTGSLATILWLSALRREGYEVGFFNFLKLGLLVMTIPLLLTLLSLFI